MAENETHTAYLTHESLKDLLENSLDATLQTGACNSKTDIVILGDLDREASDYLDSGKGAAIMKQVENDKRKTDIQLVRFSDFVRWSGLKSDIQRSASVAQFEKDSDKYVAPGKSRSRGKIFPRTLVATGGGSGSMKGLYAQASPHARAATVRLSLTLTRTHTHFSPLRSSSRRRRERIGGRDRRGQTRARRGRARRDTHSGKRSRMPPQALRLSPSSRAPRCVVKGRRGKRAGGSVSAALRQRWRRSATRGPAPPLRSAIVLIVLSAAPRPRWPQRLGNVLIRHHSEGALGPRHAGASARSRRLTYSAAVSAASISPAAPTCGTTKGPQEQRGRADVRGDAQGSPHARPHAEPLMARSASAAK